MPIVVPCPSCGKRLKAPDRLAGKRVQCRACKEMLSLPNGEGEKTDPGPAPERAALGPPPRPFHAPAEEKDGVREPEPAPVLKKPQATPAPLVIEAREPSFALRHLHWLLVLTLIPLAVSLADTSQQGEIEIEKGIEATLDTAPPDVQIKIVSTLARMEAGKADVDDLFQVLPDQRLSGAHLGRDSWMHWLYALVAAALFLGFLLVLASQGSAEPRHLLLVALFTATVGVVFLLLVQILAERSQGVWLRGNGIITVLFYVLKFIGYSYRAALDPENGFVLSFLGFTFGVGLCEELVKAMPVLWHYRRSNDQSWRGAFLWGLASGVGFGIAEAILYSTREYNGISGPGIYFVRFLSCVGLHALWSGSVGISVYRRQHLLQQRESWYELALPVLLMIGVPMVLHGLYDTLLKRGEPMENGFALVVAFASFGWLAIQIGLGGREDREADRSALLKEYARRRAAEA